MSGFLADAQLSDNNFLCTVMFSNSDLRTFNSNRLEKTMFTQEIF